MSSASRNAGLNTLTVNSCPLSTCTRADVGITTERWSHRRAISRLNIGRQCSTARSHAEIHAQYVQSLSMPICSIQRALSVPSDVSTSPVGALRPRPSTKTNWDHYRADRRVGDGAPGRRHAWRPSTGRPTARQQLTGGPAQSLVGGRIISHHRRRIDEGADAPAGGSGLYLGSRRSLAKPGPTRSSRRRLASSDAAAAHSGAQL